MELEAYISSPRIKRTILKLHNSQKSRRANSLMICVVCLGQTRVRPGLRIRTVKTQWIRVKAVNIDISQSRSIDYRARCKMSPSPGIVVYERHNYARISILFLQVSKIHRIWKGIKTSRVFVFRLEEDYRTAVGNLVLRNCLANGGDVVGRSFQIIGSS